MNRSLLVVTPALLALGLLAAACGDHGPGEDTLQGCVEHHGALSEVDAIAECLADELALDFATRAECEVYVEANGGFAGSRQAACEKYFVERAPDAGTPDGAAADAG